MNPTWTAEGGGMRSLDVSDNVFHEQTKFSVYKDTVSSSTIFKQMVMLGCNHSSLLGQKTSYAQLFDISLQE